MGEWIIFFLLAKHTFFYGAAVYFLICWLMAGKWFAINRKFLRRGTPQAILERNGAKS